MPDYLVNTSQYSRLGGTSPQYDESPQSGHASAHSAGTSSTSESWLPAMPGASLSYHATTHLDHHPHSHPHHPHLDTSVTHPHSYPSQALSAHLNPDSAGSGHTAPMLESPSYSQDRESHISDASEHENTVAQLPPYHLGLASISTPPQISGSFKRPYQQDVLTPGSSPQHVSGASNGGPPNPKRRKSSASKEPWSMTDDDTLLLQLKDEEGLPWKIIASRFKEMNRGEFRVPTLQMRYKRLKEKMRVWDPEDVQYLKEARDLIEKQKWEMISQKMVELGCKRKIPGSTCERKWREIGPKNQLGPLIFECNMSPKMMERELSGLSDDTGLGVAV